MKNALTLAVLVAAFLVACPARAQVSFGDASKFNDGWLFRLTDDSTIVNPTFDDTQWRKLTLPHDWSIEGQPAWRIRRHLWSGRQRTAAPCSDCTDKTVR